MMDTSGVEANSLSLLSLDLGIPPHLTDDSEPNVSSELGGVCLVVDPDHNIQRLVHTWLVDMQVSHTQLNKFEQAIPACTAYKYSLIFMDIDLELSKTHVRTGFEASTNIRLDPSGMNHDTPIIGITGSQARAAEAVRYGLSDALVKPFSRERISEIVKRWCGVRSNIVPEIALDLPKLDVSMLDPPDFLISGLPGPKTARVLIVEDDSLTQHVILSKMMSLTPNVSQAFDGEQALELCSKQSFDIIFMDMNMPKLNGLGATKHIRNPGNRNRNTPIIAFTSEGTKEQYEQFGFDDMLPKPFYEVDLQNIFDKWTAHVSQIQLNGDDMDRPGSATSSPSPMGGISGGCAGQPIMEMFNNAQPASPLVSVTDTSMTLPVKKEITEPPVIKSAKKSRGAKSWQPIGIGIEMPTLQSYSTAGKNSSKRKASKPRVVHNYKEQQRRSYIANAAEDLKKIIPNLPADDKATVFRETVKYVNYLRAAISPEQLVLLDTKFNADNNTKSFKEISEETVRTLQKNVGS